MVTPNIGRYMPGLPNLLEQLHVLSDELGILVPLTNDQDVLNLQAVSSLLA